MTKVCRVLSEDDLMLALGEDLRRVGLEDIAKENKISLMEALKFSCGQSQILIIAISSYFTQIFL